MSLKFLTTFLAKFYVHTHIALLSFCGCHIVVGNPDERLLHVLRWYSLATNAHSSLVCLFGGEEKEKTDKGCAAYKRGMTRPSAKGA